MVRICSGGVLVYGFDGKVALVAGGAAGIGFAIAAIIERLA